MRERQGASEVNFAERLAAATCIASRGQASNSFRRPESGRAHRVLMVCAVRLVGGLTLSGRHSRCGLGREVRRWDAFAEGANHDVQGANAGDVHGGLITLPVIGAA